jgi:hypothetical protein
VVLIIRGDLLRRYPHVDIFAVKACWIHAEEIAAASGQFKTDPEVGERMPHPDEWRIGADLPVDSPLIKRPIFQTPVRDCYFVGFTLTAAEALGHEVEHDGDAGWFFVLAERVGQPRFGADENVEPPPPHTIPLDDRGEIDWNQLDWFHLGLDTAALTPDAARSRIIDVNRALPIEGGNNFTLGSKHSAYIARALLQRPVKVYIHASQLIPK